MPDAEERWKASSRCTELSLQIILKHGFVQEMGHFPQILTLGYLISHISGQMYINVVVLLRANLGNDLVQATTEGGLTETAGPLRLVLQAQAFEG